MFGMSNTGKTRFSRLLTRFGFEHIEIDAKIEKELGPLVKKRDGPKDGLEDMARWMGFPWEPQYAENSEFYLSLERMFTLQVLDRIKQRRTGIVLDLTGSAIYTGEDVLQKLRELTTLVLFETPDWAIEEQKRLFLERPKPIYWGKAYNPVEGEDHEVALRRCYPGLVAWRNAQYHRVAHVVVPRAVYRAPGFTEVELLQFIAAALKSQAAGVKA